MITRLLIANRGEIAVRIARTAAEVGIGTVAVHSADDASNPHVRRADAAVALPAEGPAAYLDLDALVRAAQQAGCDAVHPGYGFLSESAAFARACEAAGLVFVGPRPSSLALFGDKVAAKARAEALGVPVVPGTVGATSLEDADTFLRDLGDGEAAMVKAVAGGGGRGMRVVRGASELEAAWSRCAAEADAAFGDPSLTVERFLPDARHVEVQVLGDGTGAVVHLGERECTLQRRHQKLIEVAPSPSIGPALRDRLTGWACAMAASDTYRSLGTFEFLLAPEPAFIEANPRIQVEHTVTEEVFGLDLVRLQLVIATGASLADLGLSQDRIGRLRGTALQARVAMERMDASGEARSAVRPITRYEAPSGPGVRVDGYAGAGTDPSPRFDSLLAKVVVRSEDGYAAAVAKAERALGEFVVDGPGTNIAWLRALLARPEVGDNAITTGFVEAHAAELAMAAEALAPLPEAERREAASIDAGPGDAGTVRAPMQATLVTVDVAVGDVVGAGRQVAVLEAMKMQHVVSAPTAGTVLAVLARVGEALREGAPILTLEPAEHAEAEADATEEADLEAIRPDLAEVFARAAVGLDEGRPEAVARRHARGQRTARENLADLIDPGSFVEYGAFAVAAQRARRTMDDLVANTSGDGIVTGTGTVNAALFGPERAQCALALYDYMVLAGTQGQRNHRKTDRIFGLAGDLSLPVILFAEGGGGRPGETERVSIAGLDNPTFGRFAALSGKVPLVGVVSGRCFAGNAALAGCCDVIIADEGASIGMAGPAMIEGGGLGAYAAEEVGPTAVQSPNGVVDVRVADEREACRAARQYLGYFQGRLATWSEPDQRILRQAIPENRLRSHEVRTVIAALADEGSVLELRREFGIGMVTALVRIEGRPFGLIANNSRHLGGAIDAPAADKAARFMQLCDAFGLPLVSLVDTPGFMVGPEAERTGLVRHVCRMFVTGAALTVPMFGVVLRKGYGLGAMAMLGGSFHRAAFTVSWPTGEFGGMGLEGAVRLGYRRELDAEADPAAREGLYERLLGELYAKGKAVSYASGLEIDAVIDPVETRRMIVAGARAAGEPRRGERRGFIDTW